MGEIWTGLIGIGGVLIGVLANELLYRNRRIEIYAARVFEVRLAKYEELLKHLKAGYEIASDVMENSNYSAEERHELISVAVLSIAQFTDENELYIDSEIAVHCVGTFMSAEYIQDIKNADERNDAKERILDSYKSARQMIREDSGVGKIDNLFKKIANPTISSPAIEHLRFLKKKSRSTAPSRRKPQ